MNGFRRFFYRVGLFIVVGTLAFFAMPVRAQEKRPVVVLSPGHGWWSDTAGQVAPGAVNGDLIEKDINLDVAKQTREFLERCSVEVHLTREGDDKEHTLYDVDEIVNAHEPTAGVSIHANSGNFSGAEGWYTVDGNDDSGSKELAQLLSGNIAGRLGIPDLGVIPETSHREGGLYIHHWDAPSALVEMAYLQKDAELLKDKRRDFARSIALSILSYLDQPATCADEAKSQGVAIAPYFPGEAKENVVKLENDGLVDWGPGQYELVNVNNRYGAAECYPLPKVVKPGETAEWPIPAVAPAASGPKQQVWQLQRGGKLFGAKTRIHLIVVPEQARELKLEMERQIAEWRAQGEQEIDKLLEELSRQIVAWGEQEAEKQMTQCLQGNLLVIGALFTFAIWPQLRRRRK